MKRFPQDYTHEELAKMVIHHRDIHVEVATKNSQLTEKLIAAQKELSALKRKNKLP